jgi:hypothetical protein
MFKYIKEIIFFPYFYFEIIREANFERSYNVDIFISHRSNSIGKILIYLFFGYYH